MLLRRGEHDTEPREVAPLEVASDRRARARGLLGRDGVHGALWLAPARSVHTVGMRFAIDVAHLDRRGRVLRVATMAPGRVGRIVWRAHAVVEAEAGALARWGIGPGDVLSIGHDAGSERATEAVVGAHRGR